MMYLALFPWLLCIQQPSLLDRKQYPFLCCKDEKAAKGGAWLAALVNFIYAFVPTILGIITLALINMGKFSADKFASVGARYALPVLAMNTMPALICGLLFAGIISATMSSSDSDLLGAGSIFANDIYKAVLKPDASSQSVMNVTKIVMCLVGVASMFIALFNTQSIVSILMFCLSITCSRSFFPYVMGHYWKKASKAGTLHPCLQEQSLLFIWSIFPEACSLALSSASRSFLAW